ncbi:TMEM165/GDT1 family protein [Aestuariibacter salexigens]|uniref:TMEM165/GDT1 family protein n=1 Tax=Aestuariibacter salexigens TaxID=226010 RepID=UPI00040D05CC|nr:TMEM165/GDT1 family protein [Aestuariibacter salexigens]
MELKAFLTVFIAVFVAEIGDKTQLATMLFASDKAVSKWTVFLASSGALVLAAGIGVVLGHVLSNYIDERTMGLIAGVLFVVIGCVTFVRAWTAGA